MPAFAARRAPLIPAGAAVLLAAVVGVAPIVRDARLSPLLLVAVAPSLALLGIAQVRGRPAVLGVAVFGLALVNAFGLSTGPDALQPMAPAVGIALYVVAELTYASFDLRRVAVVERPVVLGHIVRVAAISAAAAAVSMLLLGAASAGTAAGVAARVTGLVGAGAIIGLAGFLLWRSPRRPL